MSGDWIKMSTDLRTHPKVVRISSALRADRFRVIGGLHAVWCLFDAHSEDGSLSGYTLDSLDDLTGWSGFSEAMVGVEWLIVNQPDGLSLPRFDTHNGASAKRRAQEADRKRTVRNLSALASAFDADKKRTRGEERREEKKEKGADEIDADSVVLNAKHLVAEGVDLQIARDWLKVRKAKKAPLTQTAWDSVKAEAVKAGMTTPQAVKHAAESNWQGFKASWLTDVRGAKSAGANGDAYRGNEL